MKSWWSLTGVWLHTACKTYVLVISHIIHPISNISVFHFSISQTHSVSFLILSLKFTVCLCCFMFDYMAVNSTSVKRSITPSVDISTCFSLSPHPDKRVFPPQFLMSLYFALCPLFLLKDLNLYNIEASPSILLSLGWYSSWACQAPSLACSSQHRFDLAPFPACYISERPMC